MKKEASEWKKGGRRGLNSENRFLRGDRSPMPDELRRGKSRERQLAPPDHRSGVKPTDADRDTATAHTSRFIRSGDSKFGANPYGFTRYPMSLLSLSGITDITGIETSSSSFIARNDKIELSRRHPMLN